MGKQAPAAPDYTKVAAEQATQNRPNISTGNATQQWGVGPDGRPVMQTKLTPMLGYTEEALRNQTYQNLSQPMDWKQFGDLGNGDQARQQAIDAAYGQATSRLNPQWQQRETQMRSQLANQGLDPNSQAARAQNQQFSQQRNDAYGSAMNSAIAQGQTAGDSVFKNNMMQRQQMVSEALRRRGQPMDELSAMQQFYQMPGFQSAGNSLMEGAQLQDEANWRRYDDQRRQNADIAGGIMQFGTALPSLFMLSDARAKTDIVRFEPGPLPGVPWASWRYRPEHGGGYGSGVIAQDLEAVAPQFVRTRPDGLKEVDYSFLERES